MLVSECLPSSLPPLVAQLPSPLPAEGARSILRRRRGGEGRGASSDLLARGVPITPLPGALRSWNFWDKPVNQRAMRLRSSQ